MWGSLDGVAKIELARDALAQAFSRAAQRADIGLIAYGHRRKRDCSDVEVLRGPYPGGRGELIAHTRGISPRGRTPMTEAITLAFNELVAANQGAADNKSGTVLVVTDGYENCRRDPCAEVARLREENPWIRVNLVAIALKARDRARLQCMPKAGGGRMRQAFTASELEEEIAAAVGIFAGSSVEGDAPQAANQGQPEVIERSGPPRLVLGAVKAADNRAISDELAWRIYPTDEATRKRVAALGATPSSSDGAAAATDDQLPLFQAITDSPVIDVPEGNYRVEVDYGLTTTTADIAVAAKGTTRMAIPITASTVRLAAYANPGSPALEAVFFTLAQAGDSATTNAFAVSREARPVYHIPPGQYRVAAQFGLAKAETTVSLRSGEDRDLDLFLYVGALTVSTSEGRGRPALSDKVLYIVEEDDPEASTGRREVARSAAPQPTFTLPAGVYHLTAQRGSAQSRQTVIVRPGRISRQQLELKSATLRGSARLSGSNARLTQELKFKVYSESQISVAGTSSDGEPAAAFEPIVETSRPSPTLHLGAGRYRVFAKLGRANARSAATVTLAPAEEKDVELAFDAGRVRFSLSDAAGAPLAHNVYWSVADETGTKVWQTGARKPRVYLAAGRYVVTVSHRGESVVAAFEVLSGDDKAVTLTISH